MKHLSFPQAFWTWSISASSHKNSFLKKSVWWLFQASDDFLLISGICYALEKTSLDSGASVDNTKPSYDTIIQFNCWKKKFWSIFCKEERPLHWAPVNFPKVKMTHFFQKVSKQWKIIQNGRENIPKNRWVSHFNKLIELSLYET